MWFSNPSNFSEGQSAGRPIYLEVILPPLVKASINNVPQNDLLPKVLGNLGEIFQIEFNASGITNPGVFPSVTNTTKLGLFFKPNPACGLREERYQQKYKGKFYNLRSKDNLDWADENGGKAGLLGSNKVAFFNSYPWAKTGYISNMVMNQFFSVDEKFGMTADPNFYKNQASNVTRSYHLIRIGFNTYITLPLQAHESDFSHDASLGKFVYNFSLKQGQFNYLDKRSTPNRFSRAGWTYYFDHSIISSGPA